MPAVCLCDCGMTVNGDGQLCQDWSVMGVKRVCDSQLPFSSGVGAPITAWSLMRDQALQWTNQTCRTHRVIASVHLPSMRMKMGRGNAWEVRMMFDGAVGGPPPYDDARSPELYWLGNWYLGMPAGTDSDSSSPGYYDTEFLVPPGETLNVVARVQIRTLNFTNQPNHLVQFGALRVALTAYPSDVDSGSGRQCIPAG